MADKMTVTYHDVSIEYREDNDRWYYELDGRERSAESLANAKKAIDATPKPKKTFKPFQAYLLRYGAELQVVTVTSQASETDSWDNSFDFWVTIEGKRRKESGRRLYCINDKNDGLMAESAALDKEIKRLTAQREAVLKKLEHIAALEAEAS